MKHAPLSGTPAFVRATQASWREDPRQPRGDRNTRRPCETTRWQTQCRRERCALRYSCPRFPWPSVPSCWAKVSRPDCPSANTWHATCARALLTGGNVLVRHSVLWVMQDQPSTRAGRSCPRAMTSTKYTFERRCIHNGRWRAHQPVLSRQAHASCPHVNGSTTGPVLPLLCSAHDA